jgi:hypothetical protein
MNLTTSELISLASLGVSCIAGLIAARSLRNSSKALRLAESDNRDKRLGIGAYLVQTRKVVVSKEEVFAAFALSFTNLASTPNALSSVELVVVYTDEKENAHRTILQSEKTFPAEIDNIVRLDVPINIAARASVMGWLVFKLPAPLQTKFIKSYEVAGNSVQGEKVSVVSYLLMETIFRENPS